MQNIKMEQFTVVVQGYTFSENEAKKYTQAPYSEHHSV
jgi:hypothetical protein